MRRVVTFGLVATISIMGLGSASVQQNQVLVAAIEYVEPRDSSDYEKDKALYAHDNTQVVVVQVERPLTGDSFPKRIVVRIAVDDPSVVGVKWVAGSYGVLDATAWRPGARIVLVLTDSLSNPKVCPPLLAPKADDAPHPELGDSLGEDGGALKRYASYPLYCASVRNVLLLRE